MSKQEFSRLDVLLRVQSGRLRVSDACVLIGLQRRQVFRLLRGLKQDGARSRLMQLRFVTSESAFDYFRTTRAYLEEHGKPVAFYSDKHGIFRVNSKEAAGGDGVTQFGRALLALNIDIICANSPQAKGRIERALGTVQDRMVKSLPPRRRGSCGWRGSRRWPRRT